MSSSPKSTTPAVQKVTADVWLNVCDELLGRDGSGNYILPLLQVCRKWKDLFTPALYRHLRVVRRRTHEELYVRFASGNLTGNPVGQWCQSLNLDPSYLQSKGDRTTSFPALLVYLPNLCSFSTTPGSSIRAFDLDSLTHTCKETLHSLSITVSASGSLRGLGLGFISRLTRLTQLSVTANWDGGILSLERVPGFNMPALKSLSWSTTEEPIYSYLTFLSRCQFPAIEQLALGLPALSAERANALAPFLKRYSSQITSLDITLPLTAPALCAILQSTTPECLKFTPRTAYSSVAPDIPRSVRHLRLVFHTGGPAADGFWELLDQISTLDPPLSVTHIILHPVDGTAFQWTNIHRIPLEFAVRLVRSALKLADRGILTQDADGKGIQLSRAILVP